MAKAKKEQTVTLKQDKKCKSCMRFKGEGKDAADVGASFYLQNAAFEALGKPKSIVVTVTSSD